MTVVVAYKDDARSAGALDLGAVLARSTGERLVVCCVLRDRWEVPVPSGRTARPRPEAAEQALADARRALGDSASSAGSAGSADRGNRGDRGDRGDGGNSGDAVDAEYVVRGGRSVPRALVEEAAARGARLLVLGSSASGPWGHVALGAVADRLVHSAAVPLALAPRGYRAPAPARVTRVSVALGATPTSPDVLLGGARFARDVGAELRVLTFGVGGRTMVPSEVGLHAEDEVRAEWRRHMAGVQRQAVAGLEGRDDVTLPGEVRIVEGRDWAETLDRCGWQPGDVLVLGSSFEGPLQRVFLGSTATRILRSAPVPVLLLPTDARG